MEKSQHIPVGLGAFGVLVVLILGLAGCAQGSADRPLDNVVRAAVTSTPTGSPPAGQGTAQGEALFATYCQACHGEKGAGTPRTKVALRDAARGMDQATLTGIITNSPAGAPAMPAFGKSLTAEQITDLAAFIRSW